MDKKVVSLPSRQLSYTYVTPYYGSVDTVTVFYRETKETSMLRQLNKDIRNSNASTSFKASSAFLTTFLSKGRRFQVALVADGEETFGVFNYEELDEDADLDIGFNEVLCRRKIWFSKGSSGTRLIKNTNTGVRGRFVYLLSTPGCFEKIFGIRALREPISQRNFKALRNITNHLQLLGRREVASVVLYVKELVSDQRVASSINIISKDLSVSGGKFTSNNGIFYGREAKNVRMRVNNLFVFNGTPTSRSFQYGQVGFISLNSRVKCVNVGFNQTMVSTPVIKLTAVSMTRHYYSFFNVWLKGVTSRGFTTCAKAMVDFIGPHNVRINYLVFTQASDQVQESHRIRMNSPQDKYGIQCILKRFKQKYLEIPYVFTSVEDVDGANLPVIGWTKMVTNTSAEVCIKAMSMSSYAVHLLVKGQVDPCNNFTCPNHLECKLSSSLTPFCDCIETCSDGDENLFCGSDYQDYESVCKMNKMFCQRYGNYSKTVVNIKHYGKCQSE